MKIKTGDTVRSYDFKGQKDCYVEGVVREIKSFEGCDRYVIIVHRDVYRGLEIPQFEKSSRVGQEVFPPVNGTPRLFGGYTGEVELV
jgi:hypothetical protein